MAFIDDLQWIDAASLRLLRVIRSDFDQPGLLVIGAYRDNEVDESHPLTGFIGEMENEGIDLKILKLENLPRQHIDSLLTDSLGTGQGVIPRSCYAATRPVAGGHRLPQIPSLCRFAPSVGMTS